MGRRQKLLAALRLLALASVHPRAGVLSRPELEGALPPGYALVTTTAGDFDGDGVVEVAASITDAGASSPGDRFARAQAGKQVLPSRVVVIKPSRHGARQWREVPPARPTGLEAVEFPRLRAVNLVGDRRPELVVMERDVFGGSAGWYDLHVYVYRHGRFEEVWNGLGSRLLDISYGEVARRYRGREIVVVASTASYSEKTAWGVSVYGYSKGCYRLIQERSTVGRHSEPSGADEVLRAPALGARLDPASPQRRVLPGLPVVRVTPDPHGGAAALGKPDHVALGDV
jgi:hypothetical protein